MKVQSAGSFTAFYAWIGGHRRVTMVIASVAALLFFLGFTLKNSILLPLLLLTAAFSVYYRKFRSEPPAFELLSLTTVAVGVTHGPVVGMIFGGIAELASEILNGRFSERVVWYVPARMIMGGLAGILSGEAIVFVGILLVVIYNILAQFVYIIFGDPHRRFMTFLYIFLNVPINWLLFLLFGLPLTQLLL